MLTRTIRLTSVILFATVALGCSEGEDSRPYGSSHATTGTCGNNRAESGERCDGNDVRLSTCEDLQFGPGVLGCALDCQDFDLTGCGAPQTCGNGMVDPPEACDGEELGVQTCAGLGLGEGVLQCLNNCAGYDTSGCGSPLSCGDGTRDGAEVCDGSDFGALTCQSLGLGSGALACASDCLSYDVSGCQAGCEPACDDRQCGPDPDCGLSCGTCSGSDGCNAAGQCGPWCTLGETRCSPDGYGFEACGVDPTDPDTTSFGPRVPCALGDSCAGAGCAVSSCLETEVTFLLDRSSSMLAGDTWEWVTQSFVDTIVTWETANRFGLRQFPSGSGCTVGSVMGMVKNGAGAIAQAIDQPGSSAATPIEAALGGFLTNYGDPNDGQAVILLTDGDETCGSQQGAIDTASALWRAGVRVYAVAITTTANKPFLDQVANAGGTGSSIRVASGAELRSAIDGIMLDLEACACEGSATRCSEGHAYTCSSIQSWTQTETCIFGCVSEGGRCAEEGDLRWWGEMPRWSGNAPAVSADGTIYVTDGGNQLHIVAADGSSASSVHFDGSLTVAPALMPDGRVVLGSDDSVVFVATPAGVLSWSATVSGPVAASPAVAADGTVLVPVRDSGLVAFSSTGAQLWSYALEGQISSAPALDDNGNIYVASLSSGLHALTPTGSLLWTFATVSGIVGSPAVTRDGTVYFVTYNGTLYKVSSTGAEAWSMALGSWTTSSPVIGSDGTIYVGSNSNILYAINANGTTRWTFPTSGPVTAAPAIAQGGVIYAASATGSLYALDAGGSLLWQFDGSSNPSPPTILSDGTVVFTAGARLNALWASYPLADSDWPKFGGGLANAGRREQCVPDCSGRQCGLDPVCGTSCGWCDANETCNNGQCLGACVPSCSDRECGPDPVCGTSCGTCNDGTTCSNGACTADTQVPDGWQCDPQYYDAADGCDCNCGAPDPDCSLAGQTLYGCAGVTNPTCDATGQCVEGDPVVCDPDCTMAICGDDGCGGSCGTCPTGQTCWIAVCM